MEGLIIPDDTVDPQGEKDNGRKKMETLKVSGLINMEPDFAERDRLRRSIEEKEAEIQRRIKMKIAEMRQQEGIPDLLQKVEEEDAKALPKVREHLASFLTRAFEGEFGRGELTLLYCQPELKDEDDEDLEEDEEEAEPTIRLSRLLPIEHERSVWVRGWLENGAESKGGRHNKVLSLDWFDKNPEWMRYVREAFAPEKCHQILPPFVEVTTEGTTDEEYKDLFVKLAGRRAMRKESRIAFPIEVLERLEKELVDNLSEETSEYFWMVVALLQEPKSTWQKGDPTCGKLTQTSTSCPCHWEASFI